MSYTERMSMKALTATALVIASISLAAKPCHAHGAFPQARQVVVDPGNPAHLWARTTFGMLTSTDGGASWSWICAQAVGYAPTSSPGLAVAGDGRAFAATFDGLSASIDGGCSWAVPQASLARTTTSVFVDPAVPARVLALVSHGAGDGSYANELWQSSDSGKTFTMLGGSLDPASLLLSVAVSSKDPQRVYVTGLFPQGDAGAAISPALLVSSDGGQSFEKRSLAAPLGDAPHVAAVHPDNPDQIYLRIDHASTGPSDLAKGTLLYSDDAGTTFSTVLEKNAVLLGFALSPDGTSTLVGFGDPKGGVGVEQAALGLYAAPHGQGGFSLRRAGHVGCVAFVGGELWACLSQFEAGFEIGRSTDGGATFSEVMKLSGVAGPLACEATTSMATACTADLWEDTCTDIGKCGGSGGDSATGSDAPDDGGCGCRARGSGAAPALPLLFALALARLSTRRKRR